MPWTIEDVDRHNKGLSRKEKRKWVSVANSSLKTCVSKGGAETICAPTAIKIANGVVKRGKERENYMKINDGLQEISLELQNIDQELNEGYDGYVPSDVIDFAQLDALEQSEEMYHELYALTEVYSQMITNIIYWFQGDKSAQIKKMSLDFTNRVDEILSMSVKKETATESELIVEKFSEAETSEVIKFEEADAKAKGAVAYLNVAIIKPGWGNKVDNHYYPAEMLKNYADRFVGAKMYETDHRQEEKSTRTWVSTIVETGNFTDDGAPIAKVAIHNSDFAQRVRNLASAGLVNRLECSILADGRVEPNFVLDGRKGKKVTEITEVSSVDWVTRAGAGGQALELTETYKGGDLVDKPTSVVETTTEQPQIVAAEITTTLQTAIHEVEVSGSEAVPETLTESSHLETETPVNMSEDEVRSLLKESNLHPLFQEKLSTATYVTEADLKSAIAKEQEYLAKFLEAGKVIGMGNTEVSVQPKGNSESIAEAKDRVNQKYFGGAK